MIPFATYELVLTLHFNRVWRELAATGHCDAIEGAEYRRVLKEWIEVHDDVTVGCFIVDRANLHSVAQGAESGPDVAFTPAQDVRPPAQA